MDQSWEILNHKNDHYNQYYNYYYHHYYYQTKAHPFFILLKLSWIFCITHLPQERSIKKHNNHLVDCMSTELFQYSLKIPNWVRSPGLGRIAPALFSILTLTYYSALLFPSLICPMGLPALTARFHCVFMLVLGRRCCRTASCFLGYFLQIVNSEMPTRTTSPRSFILEYHCYNVSP